MREEPFISWSRESKEEGYYEVDLFFQDAITDAIVEELQGTSRARSQENNTPTSYNIL